MVIVLPELLDRLNLNPCRQAYTFIITYKVMISSILALQYARFFDYS